MSANKSIDVLIAGAGPVGLTLALECARHDVNFRIVDKNAHHSTFSKALAIWSGTLECLSTMGVVDDFIAEAIPLRRAMFSDNGKIINEVPSNRGIDSPYPQPLLLPQYETEAILERHLEQRGHRVERETELVDFHDHGDHVTCVLQRADGSREEVTAGWLAGCDGARSIIRHKLPVEFAGETEDIGFVLMDAQAEGLEPDDGMRVNWGAKRSIAFFPVKKGVFRVFTQRDGTENKEPPTLEEMQGYLNETGMGHVRLYNPTWLSYFEINERQATRMRVGRVFLLGDAAHIHSPTGGQGMNTGMQDAFNLGWKLGLISRGKGNPELLAESYQLERHPVVAGIIKKAAGLLQLAVSHGPIMRMAKDMLISVIMRTPMAQEKFAAVLSGLEISYEDSPLVLKEGAHGTPAPGTRILDARTADGNLWKEFLHAGHTLLIFSGENPASQLLPETEAIIREMEFSSIAPRTVLIWHGDSAPGNFSGPVFRDPDGTAHERFGMSRHGWVLVRPDLYLAARGEFPDTLALRKYLTSIG